MNKRICVYCVNNKLIYGKELYVEMAMNSIVMLKKHSNIPVCVIFIGEPPNNFVSFCDINDVKIICKEWMPGFENFFLANKSYVGEIDCESVLFIDSDTFIFDAVDRLFDAYDSVDFVGIENRWAYFENYRLDFLNKCMRPFNSGIMLFNNYSQKKIFSNFKSNLNGLWAGDNLLGEWLLSKNRKWTSEEFAISKGVADLELKVAYFPKEHCYNVQWERDFKTMNESIIFHSFAQQWEMCKRMVMSF